MIRAVTRSSHGLAVLQLLQRRIAHRRNIEAGHRKARGERMYLVPQRSDVRAAGQRSLEVLQLLTDLSLDRERDLDGTVQELSDLPELCLAHSTGGQRR